MMELELQDVTAESLSIPRAQRMNRNTVWKFCNTLGTVVIENNLCDTPGNIFKIYESGIQISN
jgi:hypothetical protein